MVFIENWKCEKKVLKRPKRCEIVDIEEFSSKNPQKPFIFLQHLSQPVRPSIEIQSFEATGLKLGGQISYGIKACRMKFEKKGVN